jgi:hypothetical protein
MSYDLNVYGSPEKFGLELIAELEDGLLSYEFDMLIVLRQTETGRLYWCADNGCSCPTPFEDYDSIASLEEITDGTWPEFVAAVGRIGRDQGDMEADRTECLAKVARLLREKETT